MRNVGAIAIIIVAEIETHNKFLSVSATLITVFCHLYSDSVRPIAYKAYTCILRMFTSPAGAVAKYCDEYVCVCVCVCPQGYLRNRMRDLYQFLWTLPMAIARSISSGVTKSQGKGQFGGFLPH